MKRFPITCALILILLTLWFGTQPALAQETFSFQGRLTGPDDTPVPDGLHSVRFQLFDDETGGEPQWGEAHAVTTTDGVFSVVLGTKTTLNLDLFDEMPYLLLIVENEEMEPRVPLTAVPYAMKSYRLDEAALVPGQNVTITQRADGALQIGSTGGGGSGLSSVATDGTIEGNGTSGSPLGLADGSVTGSKLSNNALLAGANVDIVRRGNGSLEISAAAGGGGGGGLTQVASDATLTGNGTSGSPLGLANGSVTGVKIADGSVTGVKLADGALVGGQNVTITRQAGGALEVTAAGGGGLAQVASDATLAGDGTAGSPLMVAAPLELTSSTAHSIRGEHTNGNWGALGSGDFGVRGFSTSNFGVHGISSSGDGVHGSSSSSRGVFGISTSNSGVLGKSSSGNGVHGDSNSQFGVFGISNSSYGVFGVSRSSYGVYGVNGSNWGGLGHPNFAGVFNGNVIAFGDMSVSGTLSKGGGSFKIDHPLDPAGKYLSHSFVESPDMKNVYDGTVTTDANGEAIVVLPDYFEALNRDFRYQLTVIGQFAQAIIAEKIHGNQFVIRTDLPNVEVSWQVTGIRQDAWAEQHRIVVEEDKPAEERGFYLHPTLFGQPQERSILWARDPEMMRTIQEQPVRLEAERRQMQAERFK